MLGDEDLLTETQLRILQTTHPVSEDLSGLSYLSSPVPDLAATLQVVDDEAANVNFLRHSVEVLDQLTSHSNANANGLRRTDSAPRQQQQGRQHGAAAEDTSRRDRLQRVLERLNRVHDPGTEARASAYSNRTPSPNRQSLYDWAPSTRDPDPEHEALLETIRSRPDLHEDLARIINRRPAPGLTEPLPRGSLTETTERGDRVRDRERRRREQEWVSLRQRAAAQARSHRQGSPSATERMLRYVMERERSGLSEEEERARGQGWFRPSPNRSDGTEEQRSRDSWLLPPPASTSEGRRETQEPSELRESERQERVDVFRRGYLAENVPPRLPRISTSSTARDAGVSSASSKTAYSHARPMLANVLHYLSELRDCQSYEDALSVAIDHGLATKEFFADKRDDFVMDLGKLSPLSESSWLQPGAVFEGHQHASTNTAALTHRSNPPPLHNVEQINPNFSFSNSPGPTIAPALAPAPSNDATRPWISQQFSHHRPSSSHVPGLAKASQDVPHDHWPVRVILHAVDAEKMTIQGTMEAYDVPQHATASTLSHLASDERPKAGRKASPITTYVEGHIIDLRTHSFATPPKPRAPHSNNHHHPTTAVFPPSSPDTDADNWRKLPPFSHLSSDDACARLLLSHAHLTQLASEYIFMRWKERCFVHAKDDACAASHVERQGDRDREHGLTISGFYYVSLRRADGEVEGLYFDPMSTPFQRLRLKGRCAGWPSLEVR